MKGNGREDEQQNEQKSSGQMSRSRIRQRSGADSHDGKQSEAKQE